MGYKYFSALTFYSLSHCFVSNILKNIKSSTTITCSMDINTTHTKNIECIVELVR
jgi:hypothetical protein